MFILVQYTFFNLGPFAGPGHATYPPLNLRPYGKKSSNFLPYKSSYRFRYLNCCQISYLNATDLKIGSSTYFFPAPFISAVLTKCQVLKRKFRYKRTSPSHIRHNLITIWIKSCRTRGHSDLLPKELQNKTIKTNKQT